MTDFEKNDRSEELPFPDDPVLRSVVTSLRTLPPDDPDAIARIVSAAKAFDKNDRPMRKLGAGRWWRAGAWTAVAATLFGIGFVTGKRVPEKPADAVASEPSSSSSSAENVEGGIPVHQVANAGDGGALMNTAGIPITMFRVAAPAAHSVSVVGDFNGWNPVATPLARTPDGSAWTGSVSLRPGRHTYAFVIDGVVTPDPNVPSVRDPDYDVSVSAIFVRDSR